MLQFRWFPVQSPLKPKTWLEALDPPRWWKKYVYDTYTVQKKVQAHGFTDYLNTHSTEESPGTWLHRLLEHTQYRRKSRHMASQTTWTHTVQKKVQAQGFTDYLNTHSTEESPGTRLHRLLEHTQYRRKSRHKASQTTWTHTVQKKVQAHGFTDYLNIHSTEESPGTRLHRLLEHTQYRRKSRHMASQTTLTHTVQKKVQAQGFTDCLNTHITEESPGTRLHRLFEHTQYRRKCRHMASQTTWTHTVQKKVQAQGFTDYLNTHSTEESPVQGYTDYLNTHSTEESPGTRLHRLLEHTQYRRKSRHKASQTTWTHTVQKKVQAQGFTDYLNTHSTEESPGTWLHRLLEHTQYRRKSRHKASQTTWTHTVQKKVQAHGFTDYFNTHSTEESPGTRLHRLLEHTHYRRKSRHKASQIIWTHTVQKKVQAHGFTDYLNTHSTEESPGTRLHRLLEHTQYRRKSRHKALQTTWTHTVQKKVQRKATQTTWTHTVQKKVQAHGFTDYLNTHSTEESPGTWLHRLLEHTQYRRKSRHMASQTTWTHTVQKKVQAQGFTDYLNTHSTEESPGTRLHRLLEHTQYRRKSRHKASQTTWTHTVQKKVQAQGFTDYMNTHSTEESPGAWLHRLLEHTQYRRKSRHKASLTTWTHTVQKKVQAQGFTDYLSTHSTEESPGTRLHRLLEHKQYRRKSRHKASQTTWTHTVQKKVQA